MVTKAESLSAIVRSRLKGPIVFGDVLNRIAPQFNRLLLQ